LSHVTLNASMAPITAKVHMEWGKGNMVYEKEMQSHGQYLWVLTSDKKLHKYAQMEVINSYTDIHYSHFGYLTATVPKRT